MLFAFGANAAFQCSTSVSWPAGDGSGTATVTCSNDGTSAIAAPYVRLDAGDNAYVRFSETDAWSKSVEFLATSDRLPASSLQAGETVNVPVFVYTDAEEAQLTLSYTQSSAEAFPWSSIGASLKPSYVTDSAWTFALATLKSRFGTTWNSYLSRLRANADYLAENGRPVRRLDNLLQIEINHALGVDSALPVLAGVTDAARSARGMGLSFTRSYSSAMYGRFTSGILGYGWTDNLTTYAELSSDGKTLVFRVPGGGSYSFTKATGSWQPEDARDKTILSESPSAYTLTYQSGTVQTFAKSNMRISSIADNCGNKLTFTWSGTTLQEIAHTDGQTLTFSYSGGLLSSVTDDCGRQTTYTYSGSLLMKVTASDGLVTLYEYRAADGTAAACALSRIVYPDGTTREFFYDTSSGFVSAISSNGGKEMTTISRDGGVVTLAGPDGAETSIKTGVSGEVLETVDALGGISTNAYTKDGLLESVVSPSGLSGRIEHDALGRVSKSVSAAGRTTTFAYEETFGNLKTVTDAKNHAVTYDYDEKGRGKSVTFADGPSSKLEYNSRGDVVKSTNRRGETIVYSYYDNNGLLKEKKWSNGRTFVYAYDAHGNVTTAADSETGSVTMQYDNADRLKRIEYPTGRGFTFTYDSFGRLANRISLDGAVEQFAYDASGRLASVSDGNGTTYLQNVYDETTGRLSKQVNGNGTSVSYLYDKLGRVVSIEHCDAAGKIVESLQYCYDADGRCIRAASLLGEERYAYDDDGQLTAVEYPDGTDESFTYDAVGNRTRANGATYNVNAMNQYTSVSGGASPVSAITYDNDGNMISLTDANGKTSYCYDTLNRLVAVTNTSAGIRWSCRYDVFGNRVSVTDNGVTTERTYLQGALPSVAAEYVNGQLKERHIVVGAVRIADLTTGHSSPTTKYYHADLIGSTRLVTDGNGAIVDRRAYKAFGETRIGSTAASTAGYVGTLGVETDPTGLLFMRNRYYSPSLGRFIQMDPIGLEGEDVNLYRYCENEPILGSDPVGMFSFKSAIQTIGGLGLVAAGGALAATGLGMPIGAYLTAAGLSVAAPAIIAGGGLAVAGMYSAAEGMGCATVFKSVVKGAGELAWTIASGMPRAAKTLFSGMGDAIGSVVKGTIKGLLIKEAHAEVVHTSVMSDINKTITSKMPIYGQSSVNVSTPKPPPSSAELETTAPEGGKGTSTSSITATVSGSCVISFEARMDPYRVLGQAGSCIHFYVDGVLRYENLGTSWTSGNITVSGEGNHTLEWQVIGCYGVVKDLILKDLPVKGYVRNITITQLPMANNIASPAPVACTDDYPPMEKAAAEVATEIPFIAYGLVAQPRLYCYERYVVVKDSSYDFALSADGGAAISVSGLPSGFSFANGVIRGSAPAAGTAILTITASGSSGTTTRRVPFVVIDAPGQFTPVRIWSVTFNANGNGESITRRVRDGEAIGTLPLMTPPDGYEFSGWYTAPDGGVQISEDARITSDTTVYAHWTLRGKSDLYVDSLTFCRTRVYVGETFYGRLKICNKGNMTAGAFLTRFVDSNSALDEEVPYGGIPADTEHVWRFNIDSGYLGVGTHRITVTADSRGAISESNESNNSKTITLTVLDLPSTSTRVDWQFKSGYDGNPAAAFLSKAESPKVVATSFRQGETIYAQVNFWNALQYSTSEEVKAALFLDTGEHDGWYWPYGLGAGTVAYVTDSYRGLSCLQDLPPGTYTLEVLLDSDRFFGDGVYWFESSKLNNSAVIEFTVTPDSGFTVVFDSMGGTGVCEPSLLPLNSWTGLPPCTFTKDGFVFAGWARTPNGGKCWPDQGWIRNDTESTETLYAIWLRPNCYGIAFDPGVENATWSMGYQSVEPGKVAKLNPCALAAPRGRKFAGWRRADNGRRYDDGMLVFNLAEPGEVVTLTAIWE